MRHDLIGHATARYPSPRPLVTVAGNEDGASVMRTPQGETFALTPADLLQKLLITPHTRTEICVHDADPLFKLLLPELQRLTGEGATVHITANGRGQIISAQVVKGKHKWRIRDTHSLIPHTQEELGELLEEQPSATLEGQAAQIAGTVALYSDTVLRSFGVRAQITAGATAVSAWRSTIPDGNVHYHHTRRVMDNAREACFGGLVYYRDTDRHENCYHLDRNGAYASIMRGGVPVMGAIDTDLYHPHSPGLYLCRVVAPDHVPLPFVPYRAMGETFTRNMVGGSEEWVWMVSPMIQEAADQGYSVYPEHGHAFEYTRPIFDGFIDRCQELELQYQGKPARKVIKLLRNSLHGKFGQHPGYRNYHLTAQPEELWTPVISFQTGEEIDNLYYEEQSGEHAHSFPLWYAWIVGSARADLIRIASLVGYDHVLYADTDSLVLDEAGYYKAIWDRAVSIGTRYGEWKVQAHYEWFQAAKAKCYRGVTTDGELVEHVAGTPAGVLDESQWTELAKGMEVTRTIARTQRAGRMLEGVYA